MGKNVVKGTTVDGATISLPARSTIRSVTLSERLQWILDHRKISASALSLKAGQSRAYVRKLIEREPTRPDFTALERIAAIAEVPSLWLLRGQGVPTEGADAPRDLVLEREDSRVPEDDEVPQESALFRVYAAAPRGRYTTADFDAARAAIRGPHRKALPDGDHEGYAEQLLDAARALRGLGVPATVPNVLVRALEGKTQRAAEVSREVSDAFNAEADAAARAAGMDPVKGKERLDALLAAKKARRGHS